MNHWTANDWKTFSEGIALVITAFLSGLAAFRSGVAVKKAEKTHALLTEHEENATTRARELKRAVQEKT